MEIDQEVDAVTSPALRFGRELSRSREARGWSQVNLARRMGYSNGLISYIERGKRTITFNFAVKADEVFESGARFQQLWRQYTNASLLEGFTEFTEAEARCRALRTFQLSVVPGQIQTMAYATALASAAVDRGDITAAQADARVSFLASRQRNLHHQSSSPRIHAVLDEGCLRRPVGGRKVMAGQLAHLEELARRPNIVLQIAPFDLAETVPFRMPVTILTLPDRSVIGYAESQARGHVERNREVVAAWSRSYDLLQVECLSSAASLAMIRATREDLA
ncbi:helix-turn-helix domain-containing protein [Kitasatospora cheerisanensis]|uniref:Putative transcriptional regulator n=1 Tax=Kitasatospora cheerisanensis KCTC 2395 TaxID=1348663 RepID=A0A066YP41_9ACTN|nr:helix-turn-helix transcriptional regulator [Kitasatospora cheerisanensis]KDN81729.1 putative transcriptional regulator [Kitasatospora cheerisanensis KCTC 2395]